MRNGADVPVSWADFFPNKHSSHNPNQH